MRTARHSPVRASIGPACSPGSTGALSSRAACFTSRLRQRRWSGIAHGLLFFGALALICGHALFALSFVGVPVYAGWFGYLVMELGREIAGIMVFLGVLFFLLRRFFPPRNGWWRAASGPAERMEALILLTVVAGYSSESFRLALQPGGGGEFPWGTAIAAFIRQHRPRRHASASSCCGGCKACSAPRSSR
ncbi:MAG: hypothetical protein IPM40_04245 [Gammaproteobacteria bacterium]|nr:hypothetical protein [Gammaproteobacteria bacterium]